jgi:hypothetical protein
MEIPKPSLAVAGTIMLVCAVGSLFGLTAFVGGVVGQTRVERGDYLVNGILACGNCHTPKDAEGRQIESQALSGGMSFNTPTFELTAPNITPDRETGIGSWSAAEVKRALIEGFRPDHGGLAGVPLAAIMPVNFYKALLPDDLDSIVAYLQSVRPVRNAVPDPIYKAPIHREPYPDAERGFSQDALFDPVKRGAYLVTIGHCMECHSAWSRGVTNYENGLGKGGRRFSPAAVRGFPSRWQGTAAANITAHREKGIGAWSDAEVARAITLGISRDGRKLDFPMPFSSYAKLTSNDVAAIVAYLRTVPPKE